MIDQATTNQDGHYEWTDGTEVYVECDHEHQTQYVCQHYVVVEIVCEETRRTTYHGTCDACKVLEGYRYNDKGILVNV